MGYLLHLSSDQCQGAFFDSIFRHTCEVFGISYAGDGGFQLDVGGHTGLKGGIITSTGQAVQNGANRLTTGTLSYSDIRNHASYSASGGTLILTDGDPQSLAGLNRNVSTERDGNNTLKPIFDKDKIEAGFAIVEALQRETGTFLSNRAKETTQAKADLDKELAKPESERDSQKLAALTQQIQDNATWEMGGSGRLVLTALTAGAGANVTGGAVDMLQGAAANYLQGLATQQVKEIADKLDSEVARAALQGLVACAGAAALWCRSQRRRGQRGVEQPAGWPERQGGWQPDGGRK